MISAPLVRSSATTSFMRGAISATRAEAPLHQCLSHISQMTTAVAEDSQETRLVTCCHWPPACSEAISRLRFKARVSAMAEAQDKANPKINEIERKSRRIAEVIATKVSL